MKFNEQEACKKMKKHIPFANTASTILTAGMLTAAAAITALGAPVNDASAKTIALENAGQKEEDVTILELSLDTENNHPIYKVEFITKDFAQYDYEILISDGTILNIDYEAKLASAATQNARTTITLEQAKEKALAQSGEATEDATFVKESFEYENGTPVYETEFHTTDYKKYKYEFNGSTGAVISWEYDGWTWLAAKENPAAFSAAGKSAGSTAGNPSSGNTAGNPSSGSGNTARADAISGTEAAKAAALKTAKLNPADVTWGKVKRDHEDGRLVYEGEFYYNSLKYEFELDGATGVMLDWEVESIYE